MTEQTTPTPAVDDSPVADTRDDRLRSELVHAATDDGEGYCPVCGQRVHRIVGGKGYAHPGGYVAARTPAVVLAARNLVADWQQRADEVSPERAEWWVNDPEDEINDALADTLVDAARQLTDALTPEV